ncbi:MAG: hypothetical protein KDC48_04105 [Planctomycetes bacterium]|nr:hypothetical protein [Planctomycetota bacterium]
MNRAVIVSVVGVFAGLGLGLGPVLAQDAAKPPAAPREADPVERLVAAMRAAEEAATSLRVVLKTQGQLPSGLAVTTEGTLRVLRGTQPQDPPMLHSVVSYGFGDGLRGLVESSQTQNGIEIYEDNPAFGEVLVHLPAEVVTDLQWAGKVLDRADLPGMADRRAEAPLGSRMVDDLRRQFALVIGPEGKRGADAGVWLRGDRRAKVADLDPELPLADRVELFVRSKDHALLEVVHKQGDKVVQHIVVTELVVGEPLEPKDLRVDGRGQRVREVQQYLPLWEQIEEVLTKAESKADAGAGKEGLRPSKRK